MNGNADGASSQLKRQNENSNRPILARLAQRNPANRSELSRLQPKFLDRSKEDAHGCPVNLARCNTTDDNTDCELGHEWSHGLSTARLSVRTNDREPRITRMTRITVLTTRTDRTEK